MDGSARRRDCARPGRPHGLRAVACAALLSLLGHAAPAEAEVLEADSSWLAFGISLGLGYAAVEVAEDETADLLATQVGLRSILYRHWEADLELRIDFDPAATETAEQIRSYTLLLWIIADLDLLPLTPFVGLGGGVVLDGADPALAYATVGGCVGLALWLAGSWRITLRGAQRWIFDELSAMPLELLVAGEYFF
jgi:hypothetical protein